MTIVDLSALPELSSDLLEEAHAIIRNEIRRRACLIEAADFGNNPVTVAFFRDDRLTLGLIGAVRDGRLYTDDDWEDIADIHPDHECAIHPDHCDPCDLLAMIQEIEADAAKAKN